MLMFRNVSLSAGLLDTQGCQMPSRIIFQNQAAAVKSNILDIRLAMHWRLCPNSPMMHHLKYNILRFSSDDLVKVPIEPHGSEMLCTVQSLEKFWLKRRKLQSV